MVTNSAVPASLAQSPCFQLERLRRRVREEVEATLAPQRTTVREYWVLTCLVEADAASQTALSEALSIDTSDMVRLIDSLEAHKWVTRQRDPRDRRRQIVAATQKGNKAHKLLSSLVTEAEARALDEGTNKQLKHLHNLATAVLDTPSSEGV